MLMGARIEPRACVPVRAARNLEEECWRFWQGVVESFGVEWRLSTDDGKRTFAASSPSPPPLASRSHPDADETAASSPLRLDSTGCSSPLTPSRASTLGEAEVRHTFSFLASPVYVALMPPWSLVEYDPKMWMLLRKNLMANMALTALTVAYMALSHSLTTPSRPSSAFQSGARTSLSPNTHDARGTAESRSLLGWILLCWMRLLLWILKYLGQWPLYTVLQIVGLVWYSQLYRETWLVRKGWVLRGTRLREASPLTKKASTSAQQPTTTMPAQLLPLPEGVTRPWLAPISLRVAPQSGEVALLSSTTATYHLVWRQASLLLHASITYSTHAAHLLLRMLRHKGPTTPLQEWVLGDASAAATAAARRTTASSSPLAQRTSPDIFETITSYLESTSEVIFKALATMSFAFFASCVELLPFIGTPLCLLLNAQLYAFYVFDYRYAAQQQPDGTGHRGSALTYQLHHFAQCWMYYAGYGIGSAILSLWLTHHAGVVVSVCVMSVVYSWQVVWSGFAVPLPSSRPLPVFSLWFYAVDAVRKHYAVLWRLVAIVALLYIPYQCLRYM
ncbi:hypothetical protein ABL78_3384 [Leptomonas seymouri]|uniref:Uncharacterized protein n=1 Tax=Leptomonas seymouri TaxID=5684 RepID=A0A0N1PDR7_LEPSE|nr:hypothetical protein ABL78_3384 [Leptomonas seymouri]|eukprot:KPI87541.1 hypothetical protein ABL78_3384 [Leptomonas seymouri]